MPPVRSVLPGALLIVLGLLLAPGAATARQTDPPPTGSVVGQLVARESGEPIQGAVVQSLDQDDTAVLTDAAGRFQIFDLPAGVHMLEVFQLAYGRTTHLVNIQAGITVEMEISLGFSALLMDSLIVEVDARITRPGEVGFYERQRRPWGRHLSADDPALKGLALDQMLTLVPRIDFVAGASPFDRVVRIRSPRGMCAPTLFVDGHRFGVVEEDLG